MVSSIQKQYKNKINHYNISTHFILLLLLHVHKLEQMQSLEGATFASKDIVNQHLDTVKYKDLEDLKGEGGPFAKGEEVEVYMKGNETPEEKNKRLYVEVSYAKNTSLRLKHSDPVFRLKRDNRNLSNEEYAENLIHFLGSAHKTASISSHSSDMGLNSPQKNRSPLT